MNALIESIRRGLSLTCIPVDDRPSVVQTVFVASGCDYTSFFAGVGKATFYKSLFTHSHFICDDTRSQLQLHDVASPHSFSAFLRLVTAAYYTRHRSAFHSSLIDLFSELCG